MGEVLDVKNLTKIFGGFTAVDNVSFLIKEGEVLGLLGPNGAGKTTTIQMLLGVMEPTKGEITYFGKVFKKHREEILEEINFSSGYISLPWRLTVEEILTVFAKLYGIPDETKRISKLLSIFEIEELRKKQFLQLSAGQKSRVLLVKAFLNYPRIILLDEPTASLDPDIAKKVRTFLKKEKSEFNVSILFTSHNMAEVEEVCDRLIFIDHGRILKEGTPLSIARETSECRLQLMVESGKEKVAELAQEKGYSITEEKPYVTIAMPEKEVATLLMTLAKKRIAYEEISIDKPTLEDFFLKMTGGSNAK
jgi:ABC-2 type transport system ATP-binding protein